MSRIPRQARRDANEPTIVQALEAMGFSVTRISGAGVPDLVVGKGAWMRLVEIKAAKGTYTPAQKRWREQWRGPAPITLRSIADAQRFMVLAMER